MSEQLKSAVKDLYGATARGADVADAEGTARVAAAFGYSEEELAAIPEGSNLGLSCGNPTALANLREGEVVLDLGSGGGIDVFLAAKAVGATGKAIGLDMTEDMINLARKNAEKTGITNAEFVLGDIEDMPIDAGSVDCIISNCVINLTTSKETAFKEMFRVLKPGGRVAISDIALKKELPDELKESVDAYVGCIAGAITSDEFLAGMNAAGFNDIKVVDAQVDLNAYGEVDGQSACCSPVAAEPVASSCCGPKDPEPAASSCCGPSEPAAKGTDVHDSLRETMKSYDLNDYAASVKVYAVKPA
ncbi:arsenite methyltransferase [Parvularcula marina]|uniref:arsenite methyltransferase n=1 Tax=Parvularcula marina TaxID=2292771 RepID=UPI003513E81B